jgi:hypothetical protein
MRSQTRAGCRSLDLRNAKEPAKPEDNATPPFNNILADDFHHYAVEVTDSNENVLLSRAKNRPKLHRVHHCCSAASKLDAVAQSQRRALRRFCKAEKALASAAQE